MDDRRSYDVLYVVDPSRLWYEGGDAATFQRLYYDRLRRYTRRYSHVVMVGDSMGASAALMCSPLATAVLAFCPQVCWWPQVIHSSFFHWRCRRCFFFFFEGCLQSFCRCLRRLLVTRP